MDIIGQYAYEITSLFNLKENQGKKPEEMQELVRKSLVKFNRDIKHISVSNTLSIIKQSMNDGIDKVISEAGLTRW